MQVANATTQAATAPHYALPECGGPQKPMTRPHLSVHHTSFMRALCQEEARSMAFSASRPR